MKLKDIAMKASGLGALKKVGDMLMEAGGKLRMVTNEKGEKVPFYAADGKGKMKKGGKVKKKKMMYGSKKKKKKMAYGGKMEFGHGGKMKAKKSPKGRDAFSQQYD
jgi:hypothetical protein